MSIIITKIFENARKKRAGLEKPLFRREPGFDLLAKLVLYRAGHFHILHES
jgi:hypothetical protein